MIGSDALMHASIVCYKIARFLVKHTMSRAARDAAWRPVHMSERYVAVDLMTSVCGLAESLKNALPSLFWSDDPVNQTGIQGE